MTTSITADLLTDSTSSESATAELTDSTTPATDNNSTTDSATSSQTTTDSAISSQTTTDAATSSQIATDATTTQATTDAVTPQTTTDAVTPQTTAVACFDCECAITVAGITVTGPRKFNLSNNKTVICILDAVQNHKWTVIQRRFSTGSQSFDQDWIDYENGFGTLASEFWIGNKYIHELTSIYGNTHLLIEMVAGTGNMGFAEYTFFIDDAIQDYRLHVSNYVGNRGDPLTSTGTCTECADGMKFTTRDRDNDMQNLRNCATYSRGGWWHNACQRSNLNGQFGQSSYVYGLNWDGFMDISSVEMKVRKP
ncbi:angiopoietin-related protein 7-like [Saccostrea echinata]|uniref:angiopoietin-related protein 7-like n=1 Tax=Saccostrea echinata TaxID=191078 RepID=UPI002A80CD75|nr:angiopoietin-related protein 7-like [Saccostrea echinata]